jgi:hypothetical protein
MLTLKPYFLVPHEYELIFLKYLHFFRKIKSVIQRQGKFHFVSPHAEFINRKIYFKLRTNVDFLNMLLA